MRPLQYLDWIGIVIGIGIGIGMGIGIGIGMGLDWIGLDWPRDTIRA